MADTPASTPPFPLPDLPRAPASELGALALCVLEWRDVEALTRLPDMLMDMGRDRDASLVKLFIARWCCPVIGQSKKSWDRTIDTIVSILWWDIFDWQQTLAKMGRDLDEISKYGKFNSDLPVGFGTTGFGPPLSETGGVLRSADGAYLPW